MRTEPCARRPIRFLDLLDVGEWRLKVYGIAYLRRVPRPEVVNAALALASRILPSPAMTDFRYGVGFAGVRDARDSALAFFDWWETEIELHHRAFVAPPDAPTAFRETTATGPMACIFGLRVLCHERQAWLDHVLRNPKGPDLDAYLNDRLNEDA